MQYLDGKLGQTLAIFPKQQPYSKAKLHRLIVPILRYKKIAKSITTIRELRFRLTTEDYRDLDFFHVRVTLHFMF